MLIFKTIFILFLIIIIIIPNILYWFFRFLRKLWSSYKKQNKTIDKDGNYSITIEFTVTYYKSIAIDVINVLVDYKIT